ncbi:MAG: FecR domain-containing protein [Treponema sp.]|nr:FecR domain-containing protein [Treponema sp.]
MKVTFKCLIGFALVACSALSAFAFDAKVTSVTGKVQMQKKGSSEWIDLFKGDTVEEGAIISTGFNSNATLRLGESVCTIAPLTRMSVEQLTRKDVEGTDKNVTKTTVYIDTGKASFKVNSTSKNLNDFKVHTPASTASVRGTEFDSYGSGETDVREGLVGTSDGETREAVEGNKNNFFISDGKALTGFSQTKDVGGGLIPVFAGQRITISNGNEPAMNPLNQRFSDAYSLPGDSANLGEKIVMAGGAVVNGSIPSAEGTDLLGSDASTSYTTITITAASAAD